MQVKRYIERVSYHILFHLNLNDVNDPLAAKSVVFVCSILFDRYFCNILSSYRVRNFILVRMTAGVMGYRATM